MKALMTLFWRLAIFRAGPEDTPYSPTILAVVLMMWTGLQLVVGLSQNDVPAGLLLVSQWLALGILLFSTLVLLSFKGLAGRWMQTAIALVGVDVVLSIVNLPLLAAGVLLGGASGGLEVFYLLLVSWQLAAQAFIFHRALKVGPFLGLAIAMMLLVLSFGTIATVLPSVLVPAS